MVAGGAPHEGEWSKVYAFLDIGVNLILVTEVVIRMIAFGPRFWDSCWNKFDVVLTVICIATPLIYIADSGKVGEFSSLTFLEEEIDLVLISLRYILPLLRLVLWVKNNKQRINDNGTIPVVDFGVLDMEFDGKLVHVLCNIQM